MGGASIRSSRLHNIALVLYQLPSNDIYWPRTTKKHLSGVTHIPHAIPLDYLHKELNFMHLQVMQKIRNEEYISFLQNMFYEKRNTECSRRLNQL